MNGILEYYHCPPGYCQCTKLDDSDVCNSVYDEDDGNSQCVCDREGTVDCVDPAYFNANLL